MAIRTETIVTRYEVHTISHEQGVDRIRQKQKQLELQLKDWNEEAKRMEAVHAAAWKKVGIAIAGVAAAIVVGRAAFQSYAQEQRAATAAGAVSIERLSAAAGGLQTRMELLQFAAVTQTGAFKLSTSQMEVAQKAIRAITREHGDQEAATQKVTEALVKLEGDGLKDFGIRVREATSDSDRFAAIMEALAGKARAVDGATASEAESVQQLGVRFEDSFQKIKVSIGQVVVAMTPLIEGVATLTEYTAGFIGNIGALADFAITSFTTIGDSDAEKQASRRAIFIRNGGKAEDFDGGASTDRFETYQMQGGHEADFISSGMFGDISSNDRPSSSGGALPSLPGMIGKGLAAFNMLAYRGGDKFGTFVGNAAERGKRGAELAKQRAEELRRLSGEVARSVTDDLVEQLEREQAERGVTSGEFSAQPDVGGDLARFYGAGGENGKRDADAYATFNASRSQSKLEGVFGPIGEFDVYGKAFEALGGAVSSAFSAWIDGSKSAGAAVREFISQALGATAVQLGMEALKHGAYAIGSAAFGDWRGAAQHGKAAAAFAAGAIVVGAAAKAMHSSGGGGGGGASSVGGAGSAAPTLSGGGGGGGQPSTQVTIVTGDSFADDSPRNRALRARKLVGKALGNTGVVYE